VKIKILVLGLVCLFSTFLFANEKDVVSSFESIVSKFDGFVSTSPVALISEDFGESSPSGRINYLLKLEKLNLGYDIQKTDSLVTPYSGYIIVSLRVQSNAKYGDITNTRLEFDKSYNAKDVEYNWGFQYAEDAEKVRKFAKCASDPGHSEVEWCCGDVKLLYAHQGGEWVFKTVNTEGSNKIRMGTVRANIEKLILENPEWRGAVQ